MPLRKRVKKFKGQLEKLRQALGSEDSPTQSISSLSDAQLVPPTISPAPEPSTTSTPSGSTSNLASVPSTSETARLDRTWARLKTFLQVLDKCSSVFGPLKMAMNDLVQCIGMHEVGRLTIICLI